LTQSYWR